MEQGNTVFNKTSVKCNILRWLLLLRENENPEILHDVLDFCEYINFYCILISDLGYDLKENTSD